MNYGKLDRYLIIAILVCVVACLYFLFTNKKDTNDQNNLLLAMAEKLRVGDVDSSENKQQVQQAPQKTEEEQYQIEAIADKICFGKELNDEEKKFQKKFNNDINIELKRSQTILGNILNKFLSGSKDFDEFEKEFYEFYQADIDTIVQNRKCFDSVIKKLTEGITEFTAEELQCQQNYPKEIEAVLAKIQKEKEKGSQGLSKANPPLAAGERLKIILAMFDDGIPKTVTELAQLYADKTKTKVNPGNVSTIFGKLVDDKKLLCQKIGKNNKIYHGLPEWFEKGKLKPEYKQKITS